MQGDSSSTVKLYIDTNFRGRKFLICRSRSTTIASIQDEIKSAQESLFPGDGVLWCQRLMLEHETKLYGLRPANLLGDVVKKECKEITLQAVMTYLPPEMRGPDTSSEAAAGQEGGDTELGASEGGGVVSDGCAPTQELDQSLEVEPTQIIEGSSRPIDTDKKRTRASDTEGSQKLAARSPGKRTSGNVKQ